MSRLLPAFIAVLMALSVAAPTAEAHSLYRRVDLAVKDADVRDVLTFLAKEARINLVMSEQVKGRVTLYLERVRIKVALDSVLRVHGFDYIKRENVLLVMTRSEMDRYLEDLRRGY